MGSDGYRRVIVNSRGVEMREAERQPPQDGPSLTLTIDAGCRARWRTRSPAAPARRWRSTPPTGEILAMASTPAYDPNHFSTGIEPAVWAALANDPETPLLDRVIQGTYSPGSTFKLIAATAALEEGVITPSTTFFCPGQATFYGNVFHCHKKGGHGTLDLKGAIANSCNVYFFNVGVRLEIQRLAKWAKAFGLGSPSGIDLPHEGSGDLAQPRVEAACVQDALVRGRDGVGGDRPGAGERHAAADGARGGGDRERRPARQAAPRARRARQRAGRARHQAGDDRGGEGGHARRRRGRHRAPRRPAGHRRRRQDRYRPGGRQGTAREVTELHGDRAARVVPLLRPGGAPDDRDGGAGRARQERRRGRGARGARDPGSEWFGLDKPPADAAGAHPLQAED